MTKRLKKLKKQTMPEIPVIDMLPGSREEIVATLV